VETKKEENKTKTNNKETSERKIPLQERLDKLFLTEDFRFPPPHLD